MKRIILMSLVFGIAYFFSACSKDNPDSGLNQIDQQTSFLKAGKTMFSGTSVFVAPIYPGDTNYLPNGKILVKGISAEWYDDALPCWEVTGSSFWTFSELIDTDGSAKLWGKAEIIVDGDNGQGKWKLTWHGNLTPTTDPAGIYILVHANGVGKEGVVKGMTGKWTYTMNFDFSDPTTFYYESNGYIKGCKKNH